MHLYCLLLRARHTIFLVFLGAAEQPSSHLCIPWGLAPKVTRPIIIFLLNHVELSPLGRILVGSLTPLPISDMLLMSLLPETWMIPWEGHQTWSLLAVTDQVCYWSTCSLPLHPCRRGLRDGTDFSQPLLNSKPKTLLRTVGFWTAYT